MLDLIVFVIATVLVAGAGIAMLSIIVRWLVRQDSRELRRTRAVSRRDRRR